MITRRQFARGALATVFSAGAISSCSMAKHEAADVVIIGGGIAGLNSAALLSERGLKVIVLEANSICGGRIRTLDLADGYQDVGASQIGNGYARVLAACHKYKLTLIPEDRDLLDFGMHFQGDWINTADWANDPRNKCVGNERTIPPMLMGRAVVSKYNPLKKLDDWLDPKFGHWDISLRALMEREGYSEQAKELARFSVPGISIDDTSLLRMFQESTRGKYDTQFIPVMHKEDAKHPFGEANARDEDNSLAAIYNIVGGTKMLPNAIAAQLGDAVRLNKKVASIDMTDTSAVLRCEDGSSYKSSYVISTLPFSLLRDVAISGRANPLQQKAINSMPYANTCRLYVEVTEPFWEKDGMAPSFSTDGPVGMFWAIDNRGIDRPQRAMIVMVGESGSSITARPNTEDFIIGEIERLRPAAKGTLKKVAYKDWAADPLHKGCGFSLAPGQVNAFARDMTDPWQVLHFAGEHTRRLDFGLESAMESSERVVNEILTRVGYYQSTGPQHV